MLLLVALACLAFQLRLPGTHVADRDYQAVAQVLANEARPGDVVLLYPWWTERARIFVPEGLPVVGYQGSDAAPLELHPRIWVLAQPNQPRSDLGRFMASFEGSRTPVGASRTFGNLTLQLFSNGRSRPLRLSAKEALPRATVYVEQPDGSRTPCPWNGRAHRCPTGAEVLAQWHEIDFAPHQCLRLIPPGGRARLVIEFANFPASEAVELLAGYVWEKASYRGSVGDAELGLEVNGVVTPLSLPQGELRLKRVEAANVPEGATVRVWSHAENPAERDVCFELFGFGRAP